MSIMVLVISWSSMFIFYHKFQVCSIVSTIFNITKNLYLLNYFIHWLILQNRNCNYYYRKLSVETQTKPHSMKTAALCQPQKTACGWWTHSLTHHGNFPQFWTTQPVTLTSNLSRFMTHSSFWAPSMNSDKVIWPVGHISHLTKSQGKTAGTRF